MLTGLLAWIHHWCWPGDRITLGVTEQTPALQTAAAAKTCLKATPLGPFTQRKYDVALGTEVQAKLGVGPPVIPEGLSRLATPVGGSHSVTTKLMPALKGPNPTGFQVWIHQVCGPRLSLGLVTVQTAPSHTLDAAYICRMGPPVGRLTVRK